MQPSTHSFPLQGFAIKIGWAAGLAIEDKLGCELQVISASAGRGAFRASPPRVAAALAETARRRLPAALAAFVSLTSAPLPAGEGLD